MSADPFQAELAAVATSVVKALGSIQTSAGDEVARQACAITIRLATIHLLNAVGPQAARNALAATWRDLGEDIASQNGGAALIN
jgi:hypothetical protein